MRKAISITLTIVATVVAAILPAGMASAESTGTPSSYTVVLAGGATQSMIQIWLTPDGRSFVIDSLAPLEVGGEICTNAPGNPNELVCQAPLVAGFEVNAGPGDDSVTVAKAVKVPVTMRGGPGKDDLTGGGGADKLIGGEGNDSLSGGGGEDLIFGGPGRDRILGGNGDDLLRGGPGRDAVNGGAGANEVRQALRPGF